MSRSYKHTPVRGAAISQSEKEDKKLAHRKFRARERSCIENELYENAPVRMEEVSDVWCWDKDGKYYDAPVYEHRVMCSLTKWWYLRRFGEDIARAKESYYKEYAKFMRK